MPDQVVYLGITLNGIPGWFTDGYLAVDIPQELYERLLAHPEEQKKAAEEYGFRCKTLKTMEI